MTLWQRWVKHPEQVWLRQCFFHVHLWLGVGAGMYVVLMSVTGSVIVLRDQLEKARALAPAVEWLVDLHTNLLFGMDGRLVNGIGAACLVLLCLTGAVIWWPGIRDWRRALVVNWRAPLARLSWDTHSALGFWSLLLLLMWGMSGLYFVFSQQANVLFGVIDPADKFTDKFFLWLSDLHFGRFNWFTEAMWVLLGLVPGVLSLTGVFLCCRRMILGKPSPKPF